MLDAEAGDPADMSFFAADTVAKEVDVRLDFAPGDTAEAVEQRPARCIAQAADRGGVPVERALAFGKAQKSA